jgi:C4-dicarboxylate-specific signal transduction histidine kinase
MDVEEPSPCILADVVADAVRLAEVRLKHVARVEVEVPRTLPEVFATPQRLTQVILNLLVNSGDALEEKRVAQGEIWIRGEVRDSRVVLMVEDNGPGFPPEVVPRLFEAFFTTKGPEKGTGLGLAISRELLERFGGTLHAEIRPEGGARLRVELPRHVPQPAGVTV